ncbi:MAG: hypothetical protein N3E41_08770, partial [Thermofilaceae archaeon]|nr:hypothetical protein [Thermofilaceae archaeon]
MIERALPRWLRYGQDVPFNSFPVAVVLERLCRLLGSQILSILSQLLCIQKRQGGGQPSHFQFFPSCCKCSHSLRIT